MSQVIRGGESGGGFYMAIHGLDRLQDFLERASNEDQLAEELEEAAQYELEQVLIISQRLVPVDTGLLKSTGAIYVMRGRGGFVTAAISYDTAYAIFVHENPNAEHAAPTQWKFLEQAFLQRRKRMTERVAEGVRRRCRAAAR